MDSGTNTQATTVVHTVKRHAAPQTPASDGAGNTVSRGVDSQLQRKLLTAVSGTQTKPVAIELVLSTLREVLAPALVAYIDRDSEGVLQAPTDSRLIESLPLEAPEQLRRWADETCQSGNAGTFELNGAHAWSVVMVPAIRRGRPPEVVCAVLRRGSADKGRVGSTLQLGASHITLWYILEEARKAKEESQSTSALLELLAQLDNSEDLTSACYVLVNDLRQYLGCGRIVLGLTRSGNFDCRLAAVSGLSDFDQRSEFCDRLEAVLNEALVRNELTIVGTGKKHTDEGTRAHQNLHDSTKAKSLVSAPLLSGQGDVVGAWLFLDEKPIPDVSEMIHFVRASQRIVGSRLWMLQRAGTHPVTRLVRDTRKFVGTRKFVVVCAALVLLLVTSMVPVDYKIACDCQLEPVARRFVAAPYEGRLEESLVEAGEIVTSGQVLARMDPRELRWELTGLEADYQSEKKKRDAAFARDEIALAQQSNLEMQRMDVKMQLIKHRLEHLELKSPIDGVVIVGDLKNSEGAPLSLGQSLFEIGPLDEMIVEVAIPERDILYVESGMDVEIRLDAAPGDARAGVIERISPRSETRDSQSVYVAEVSLTNDLQFLRPGMKGSAKVISDPHPLGWNLLHKAWESIAMMVGW